jgi:hypothetical protein
MATRIHRTIKVIAFNANGIERQRYELNKHLEKLHVDVILFSETHPKHHEKYFIPNYHFNRTKSYSCRKVITVVAVRKVIPHSHVDLPPFVSGETTRVCIATGNSKVMLAIVYKSPGRDWFEADISELLRFRGKYILAGDLNAERPSWNSAGLNPSGKKLVDLFDLNEFKISAPECPTHYSPAENGDVLDVVVHQNIRVSDVIGSDILDSGHLTIVFHMSKLGTFRNLLKNLQIGIAFKSSPLK